MALNLKINQPKSAPGDGSFLGKVYPDLLVEFHALEANSQHIEVNQAFFNIGVSGTAKNGMPFTYGVTLPASTVSLIKGTADAGVKASCKTLVEQVLADAWGFLDANGGSVAENAMEAIKTVIPSPAEQFFAEAEKIKPTKKVQFTSGGDFPGSLSGNMVTPKPTKKVPPAEQAADLHAEAMPFKVDPSVKPKAPVMPAGVVALKDATQIGQKVKGTDAHSVYLCIALSERVKLAARVQSIADGASVSIRAEGPFNAEIRNALKAASMNPSTQGHYSIHFQTNGVPVGRVIGAFLMGLGVDFDEQIKNVKQIGVTE